MLRHLIKALLVFRLERWTPLLQWEVLPHRLRRPVIVRVVRKETGLPLGLYTLSEYRGPVLDGPPQN
ncbi:MAG TPA: hypothetical protein EYP61_03240 [Candidatus Latescibacteria bacterium]|nr:hypothetical protein [Candidatus Latescibacterota bacterium]